MPRNVTRKRQTSEVNDPTACTSTAPMQGNATYSSAEPKESYRFGIPVAQITTDAGAVNVVSCVATHGVSADLFTSQDTVRRG